MPKLENSPFTEKLLYVAAAANMQFGVEVWPSMLDQCGDSRLRELDLIVAENLRLAIEAGFMLTVAINANGQHAACLTDGERTLVRTDTQSPLRAIQRAAEAIGLVRWV